MSCEFRIFRHFVTIFRNLVIFRMSYLLNQMRFSKTFFTFKFFSEYSFKLANLLWHKLKLIFCCQSYDVIFAPKTVKIKNPKTYDCWEYKVLLQCKVSAQTVKNWKSRLKMFTFWWQVTRRVPYPTRTMCRRVRTLGQSRDNQTKRGWPYSMSMGLCPTRASRAREPRYEVLFSIELGTVTLHIK